MRGATGGPPQGRGKTRHFNPRAPCGARPCCILTPGCRSHFNPRAPCGARLPNSTPETIAKLFQSARPVRGATRYMIIVIRKGTISIHAPRAGRDEGHLDPAQLEEIFQSTHPSRGATADKVTERLRHEISIHAPRAGATQAWFSQTTANNLFQSTRPVRGATMRFDVIVLVDEFQSARPVRGATCQNIQENC